MFNEPALPFKLAPVESETAPDDPDDDVPVSTNKVPETPEIPAFAVCKIISPDDVLCENPELISTIPPDRPIVVLVKPAVMNISPPLPLLPPPTATMKLPPPPPRAYPVDRYNWPEFPRLVVPV